MASTRSELRDDLKVTARLTQNVSTTKLNQYLNKAARAVQRATRALWKHLQLTVRPLFTVTTDQAFNLTIGTASGGTLVDGVDVSLSTALYATTGSAVASAFQAIIQASGVGATATTMTFSDSTRKYTINCSAESATVNSITISYPDSASYYDISYMLFGETTSTSSDSFTGDAAPYCQSRYKLPSDFLGVKELVYDSKWNNPMRNESYLNRSDSTGGTPRNYSIQTFVDTVGTGDSYDFLTVTPEPTVLGKRFDLVYNVLPQWIADGTANDSKTYGFPLDLDQALLEYASYLAWQDEKDIQEALTHLSLFRDMADSWINDMAMRQGGAFDRTQRGVIGDNSYSTADSMGY